MERELKEDDYQKLMAYVMEAKEKGTHLAGMSYEDGIEAVIDVMEENISAEEACDSNG